MAFEVVRTAEGPALVRCTELKSPHAFSTREGGVSESPFDSLNMGLSAGDDPVRVRANRDRFRAAAGFHAPIHVAHQVHGATVLTPPMPTGTQGDVWVTDRPGTPIGVFVADCVPILIEDSRTGAVAAVHAGWRGTAQGAVTAAVRTLVERHGSRPSDLAAAVGPAIGVCCYQVGDEVVEALRARTPEAPVVRNDGGQWVADLAAANQAQLHSVGVQSVHLSGLCTACRGDLFFSYRRDGARSGRMLAAIAPAR